MWYPNGPLYVNHVGPPCVYLYGFKLGFEWALHGFQLGSLRGLRGFLTGSPNGQLYVGTMCALPVCMSLNWDPNGLESN